MSGSTLSVLVRFCSPSSWPLGWLRAVVVTTLVACLQTVSKAWRNDASTSSAPSTSTLLPMHVWILLSCTRARLASTLNVQSSKRRMSVWVSRLTRSSVASLVFACSAAYADDCLTPSVTLTPRATTVQGTQGVFFPTDQAERLLFLSQTCLPQARRTVAAAEDLRKNALVLVETSSKALALSSLTVQKQQEMLELYRSDARALREQRGSLFDSPVFWLFVGIGVSAAGTALLISTIGGAK